jgi:hypothetical protein
MIYFILAISFSVNILFIWYIRKLLLRFWYDVEVRKDFATMLSDYSESLQNLYSLEEFHGEESIKTAIKDTNYIIQATEEFAKTLSVAEENSQGKTKAQNEAGLETNSVYQGKAQVKSRLEAQYQGYGQESGTQEEDSDEAEGYADEEAWPSEEGIIRLPEGQKVTQEAGRYRRVVPTG